MWRTGPFAAREGRPPRARAGALAVALALIAPVGAVDAAGAVPAARSAVTILDTSVVGLFHEPRHQGNDPNLAQICTAGALRVVLAFATGGNGFVLGSDSIGQPTHTWPTGAYMDPIDSIPATADGGGIDTYGQGYMLYLAFNVQAPGVGHRGLIGAFRGGGVSGRPADAATIADFEYSCEGQRKCATKPVSGSGPFELHWMYRGSSGTATQMDKDVRKAIGLGVPVWVATLTASTEDPAVGLPSWQVGLGNHMISVGQKDGSVKRVRSKFHGLEPSGHAIAIVGYDSSNYYYVDTCAGGVWPGTAALGCRSGPLDSGYASAAENIYPHVDSVTGREHVWSVPKKYLYRLLAEWNRGSAYLSYRGGRGHAPY